MEGYDFLFNFDRKYVSIYTTPLTKYSELFVESLLRVPGIGLLPKRPNVRCQVSYQCHTIVWH